MNKQDIDKCNESLRILKGSDMVSPEEHAAIQYRIRKKATEKGIYIYSTKGGRIA